MNGQPVLRFSGSPQNMTTASFLDSSFNTNFTFFIVKTKTTTGLEVSSSNQSAKWYSGGQSNNFLYANTSGLSNTQVIVSGLGTALITNPTIEGFRYDGAHTTVRFNGWPKLTSATGNLGLSGALTIGSLSNNSFYYHGDIAEIIVYNSALSDVQMDQIESYLMTKYGITAAMPPTSIPLFVFDGDSMTYGIGSTGGLTYPYQVQTLLGLTATYQNLGVSSQTVLVMDSDASTQIDPEYQALRTTNILTLFGGTNDLYFGADATTTYNRIVSYLQSRRTAGFKVIVNTILPRSQDGLVATFEADRQTINSLIRSNWSTFADGISDIASDSRIGDSGDELDPTYYVGGIHPTNTGYGVIASYVTAAIKQIMNPIVASNVSVTSSPSAPSCGNSITVGTPDLFEIRTNKNTATLYFAPPAAPYSSFYISYSRKPDVLEYGVEYNQNYSGNGGVLKYTIGMLEPNTKYYFKIRAGSGCATGNWGLASTPSRWFIFTCYH